MPRSPEAQALKDIEQLLAELLEPQVGPLRAKNQTRSESERPNAIFKAGPYQFFLEYKAPGTVGRVAAAAEQLSQVVKGKGRKTIPLIGTSYMGPSAVEWCRKHSLSWIDQAGNAEISAPGLYIHVRGNRPRGRGPGRPPNLFAPRSSRITRLLLEDPLRGRSQRDLAKTSGLDEGFTSRLVHGMEEFELLDRAQDGAVRPRDAEVLLDAWRDQYDFRQHDILRGYVAGRSGEEVLRSVVNRLKGLDQPYAATGLAAAWLYTEHVSFRLVTIYLKDRPRPSDLEALSFREDPKGANVWLVVPKDLAVFQGTAEVKGITCVSPLQTYLDLKDQPERSAEAAAELRKRHLNWSSHAG